jgi:hypothetical protein
MARFPFPVDVADCLLYRVNTQNSLNYKRNKIKQFYAMKKTGHKPLYYLDCKKVSMVNLGNNQLLYFSLKPKILPWL